MGKPGLATQQENGVFSAVGEKGVGYFQFVADAEQTVVHMIMQYRVGQGHLQPVGRGRIGYQTIISAADAHMIEHIVKTGSLELDVVPLAGVISIRQSNKYFIEAVTPEGDGVFQTTSGVEATVDQHPGAIVHVQGCPFLQTQGYVFRHNQAVVKNNRP